MERRQLQLNALRAFEAAARHGSFSKAAEELSVTHSAISHQVRDLEVSLGLRLFDRHHRGVRMTEAGAVLLPVLSQAFEHISTALESLSIHRQQRPLTVTTTPTFSSNWLIPRMKTLNSGPTPLEIRLKPSLEFLDLNGGEADVAIRCGEPPWQGVEAEMLVPIHLTPVCHPTLLEANHSITDPHSLLELPLLHADAGSHPTGEEWRLWLSAAGVPASKALPGQSFRDPALAIEAARNGLGVAMAYLELAERDLTSGKLVQAFPVLARHPYSYYLVYRPARAEEPAIQTFRDWIAREAEFTCEHYRNLRRPLAESDML